jgi:hypothetical protein
MKRSHQPPLDQVSEIDWAKLAVLIDGEGSIGISKQRPGKAQRHKVEFIYHMRTFIVNTDPRLILWCQERFGGSISGKPRADRKNHRPCWIWTVVSRAAEDILDRCLPHFIIKREQAEIALAFQKTMRRSSHSRWNGGTPDDVLVFRNHCFEELKRLKHEPMSIDATEVTN